MDVNFVAGIAATAALLVPVLLILTARLFKNGSLAALLLYYLFNALYNLVELNIISLPALFKRHAAVVFNYLDTPVMLMVLLFFCNEKWKCRMIVFLLALFSLYEIIIAFIFGLDVASSVYLLGPGTLIVLILSIYFFADYGKVTIVHGKGTGKTFMLASVIFSYGCFLVLYYLYYLQHTSAVADVFLIYYIGLFVSAVLMSVGLAWIIKRDREIKELQLTRKELALFFDN